MKILEKSSLYKTLDNLNQIFFDEKILSLNERKELSNWIAGRQGLKGAYANMFAPLENDFKGIKFFTGENLTSKASIAHILGEETLRALYILNVKDKNIDKKILAAKSGINAALQSNDKLRTFARGTYCCGKCTVAYWRNLSGEGVAENKIELESGIKYLKSLRDGKGKWRRFPFFYTLLALIDIDLPSAREEMIYASNLCKRYITRKDASDIYTKRKIGIAKRVLEKINK